MNRIPLLLALVILGCSREAPREPAREAAPEPAAIPGQAEGEWMTEAFVPFKVTLAFTTPVSQTGTLILAKNNPSGLPEHAAELRVPIRFR